MARILLTGATGYIGSHTWLALAAAGFDVVGVDNFSNSSPLVLDRLAELGGFQPVFVEADVTDKAAMDKLFDQHAIDAVVHFAAFKAVGESTQIPLAYYRNNIGGLVNVAQSMQDHGVDGVLVEELVHRGLVRHVGFDEHGLEATEFGEAVEHEGRAVGEVVDPHHVEAGRGEREPGVGGDVTGGTGEEDAGHGKGT